MGISERKEREREEMRALILEAAQGLFLENGYEKTSIRSIADRIEYSPATIYLYYKDKKELMLAIQTAAFAQMNQEFAVLTTMADPMDRLESMGKIYIQFALDHPALYDLMFILEAPMEALACQEQSWLNGMQSFDFLKLVVVECMEAGYLEDGMDPEAMALTIWSYIHGLVTLHLKGRLIIFGEDTTVQRLYDSHRLFVSMLRKTPEP